MLMDEKELQICMTLPMAVVQGAHVRKHMHVTSRQGGEWTIFIYLFFLFFYFFVV